jgi:tripartite-type tricarboxylate transporter receptor subunit TctC
MRFARILIAAVLLLAGPAFAQTSQKSMQIIVPFAPGASADGISRILAAELAARLGRQVVVENKGGAGGALGLMLLAKAAPDGDTLAVGATGALVIAPHMPNAPPLDPLRDLAAVAKLIEIPLVLVANSASGPKSVKEMIDQSMSNTAGLSYGSTGVNSGQHLSMELLKKVTGANLVHVPFRGSAPAVTAVIGGQVPLAMVDLTSAFPHIQAGTLRGLGVPHARRAAAAPDVPTISESVWGFERAPGFIGLFAPAGTPAPVLKALAREVAAILAKPDVQAKVRLLSVEVAFEDDASFAKFLADESAKWKEGLKGIGMIN